MCRLFALAADHPVTARFWLLDAPHSLRHQSHLNADGTGVGWIDEVGMASVAKRPVAAYTSDRFEHAATSLTARTMIAHIRLSSGTGKARENTHPFLMNGIVAAHNGVLRVTESLRARVDALGTADLVHGATDSEWLVALIAGEVAKREAAMEEMSGSSEADGSATDAGPSATGTAAAGTGTTATGTSTTATGTSTSDATSAGTGIDTTGTATARDTALHDGIVAALSWVARNVPVYAANLVLARDHHLYAVRLPATNELWVLDRPAGDGADEALEQESDTMRASSEDLRDVHSVVVASEPMDDDPDWRLLADGELVHVDPDGLVTSETPFPALAHPLTIADLGLSAAASQAHDAQVRERRSRNRRPAAEADAADAVAHVAVDAVEDADAAADTDDVAERAAA